MDALLNDLRYAFRMLVRSAGFTTLVVVILALGIGANSAIFTIINAILLRPLPYPDANQLVEIFETAPGVGNVEGSVSYPNFQDWQSQSQSFAQVSAYQSDTFTLVGLGEPTTTQGAVVTSGLFSLLGVEPFSGRLFVPADDQPSAYRVVLLSERLWRGRFNADPGLVGRAITINDQSYNVVGILPAGFDFPYQAPATELWIPIPQSQDYAAAANSRAASFLNVVARLKRGITISHAHAEMATIANRLAEEYPEQVVGRSASVEPLQAQLVHGFRPALIVLFGAVGLVLLAACANIANLLLARSVVRRKEIAIRIALGAGGADLVRQLLIENVLLAVLGGVLGLLFSFWCLHSLLKFIPQDLPGVNAIHIDGSVLSYTLLVSVVTGIIFGLAPALQSLRLDLVSLLKEGGRGSSAVSGHRYVRAFLVSAEVAVAMVLLVGAGLFIRSFAKLRATDPGFDGSNLLKADISLPRSRYPRPEQWSAFSQELVARTESLPGVLGAASVFPLPLSGTDRGIHLSVEGEPVSQINSTMLEQYLVVSPDFFDVMRIPLRRGRTFSLHDSAHSPNVAVISEAVARLFFPGKDPLGMRIFTGSGGSNPREIVGVVGDIKFSNFETASQPQVYAPLAQSPFWSITLLVRTARTPLSYSSTVTEQVHAVDSGLPVDDVLAMESLISDSQAQPRFRTVMLGLFATLALVLATAGVYGVVSYGVSQRMHEIGIRVALGAQHGDILRLVVSQGMRTVLGGIGIGLIGAIVLGRSLTGLVYGVPAVDPVTFSVISAVLLFVGAVACCVPVLRALRIDPLDVLRHG
jgi:putative ABC transport system permease protein